MNRMKNKPRNNTNQHENRSIYFASFRVISRFSICSRRQLELGVLIAGCLAFGYFFSSCSKPENNVEIAQHEATPSPSPEFSVAVAIDPNADFSKFQHSNATHARFPCALCHERKDNSATPKLPGHIPCASCHVGQFADNKNAICTICHTNAETAAMKSFPALKSFNARFDHARHLRETNCAACHRPARGGVALSIPASLSAHNSCFTCHSPGAKSGDKNIDSCDVCHQPGNPAGGASEWVKAYTATPFSHAKHKLDCTVCHTIMARGNQVGAPIAAMHFARKGTFSCASCHNNKRAFGGDDFSDCRRCHGGGSYKFS
jgi:c(7)-type cytochrome triheme protein